MHDKQRETFGGNCKCLILAAGNGACVSSRNCPEYGIEVDKMSLGVGGNKGTVSTCELIMMIDGS